MVMPGRTVSTAAVTAACMILCYTCCWCSTTMSHAFSIEPLASSATIMRKRRSGPLPRRHVRRYDAPTTSIAFLIALPHSFSEAMEILTTPSSSTTISSNTIILLSSSSTAPTYVGSMDWSLICYPPYAQAAFNIFYVLIILFPHAKFTKQVLDDFQFPAGWTLFHCLSIYLCLSTLGHMEQTSPGSGAAVIHELLHSNDNMATSMNGDATTGTLAEVAMEMHRERHAVLTWDFFVPWWIWRDGLRRNIVTSHSIFLCWFLGPCGLVLHWMTCLLNGHSIVGKDDRVTTNHNDD